MRRALWSGLGCVLLVAGAAGCGDDDNGGSTTPTPDNNMMMANNGGSNNGGSNNGSNNGDPNNGDPNNADPNNQQTNNNNTSTNNGTPVNNSNNDPATLVETDDFADCFVTDGCDNDEPLPLINLSDATPSSVQGVIDGETHVIQPQGEDLMVGDIDVITFQAPARSVIDMTLTKLPGSMIDPILRINDGFTTLAFVATPTGVDSTSHRVLYPYVSDGVGMFVVLDEYLNFDAFPNGPYVGGDNFGWELTWEVSDFTPVELGTLAPGATLTGDDELSTRGEMHFYRFDAAAGVAPSITVTPGTGDMQLVVSLLDTRQGQALYTGAVCGNDGEALTKDWTGLPEQPEEHIVAIWECNGRGMAGFTYDLTISAP